MNILNIPYVQLFVHQELNVEFESHDHKLASLS